VYKFSHAVFVCVFLVLVDTFVNVILFITSRFDYHNWCISTSSNHILQNVNTTLNGTAPPFDFAQDFYNCYDLWEDELKFGIIFLVLMLAFYVNNYYYQTSDILILNQMIYIRFTGLYVFIAILCFED
jgi:hypothetical protein